MAEGKVIYHEPTVSGGEGPANPPPYTPGPPGAYPHPSGAYPHPSGAYPHPSGAYPLPPGTYVQQTGPYGPTMVQATVVPAVPIMMTRQIGPHPARVTCKTCNLEIVTRVDSSPTMRTHLFAAILCLLGCWPCVCLPYCMDSCLNTDHYCPNCNAYVGTYMT